MKKQENDILFENNIDTIKKLSLKNWLPSQIAKHINMDRHCLLNRMKAANIYISSRKIEDGLKRCSCCKQKYQLSFFHKKDKSLNNYSGKCKYCRKSYLNSHKENYILMQTKSRAKQRGWEFDITIEDIVIPEYCPILNVKLDINNYRYSPSIDRIDSKKGYVKNNIQIISTKANNMKNDATEEELLSFSKYYIKKLQ